MLSDIYYKTETIKLSDKYSLFPAAGHYKIDNPDKFDFINLL